MENSWIAGAPLGGTGNLSHGPGSFPAAFTRCCWGTYTASNSSKGHVEPRSSSDPGGESTAPLPCLEGGRSLNRHVPSEMKWFMSQRSLH